MRPQGNIGFHEIQGSAEGFSLRAARHPKNGSTPPKSLVCGELVFLGNKDEAECGSSFRIPISKRQSRLTFALSWRPKCNPKVTETGSGKCNVELDCHVRPGR